MNPRVVLIMGVMLLSTITQIVILGYQLVLLILLVLIVKLRIVHLQLVYQRGLMLIVKIGRALVN